MAARRSLLIALFTLLISACAVVRTAPVQYIALLAPFEGRYSEIGYDALYAARLALADAKRNDLELLPIDDGGTTARAAERARALAHHPQNAAVIALGYFSADAQTQEAYGDLPVLIVGGWTMERAGEHVFILSSHAIAQQLTVSPQVAVIDAAQTTAPLIGGEVFALRQFPLLRQETEGIRVFSSALLPTTEFQERYLAADPFAKPPGLLAMLTYDAVRIAADAVGNDRPTTQAAIASVDYEGLNGAIRFEGGFWANAPIHTYEYTSEGQLIASDDPIE